MTGARAYVCIAALAWSGCTTGGGIADAGSDAGGAMCTPGRYTCGAEGDLLRCRDDATALDTVDRCDAGGGAYCLDGRPSCYEPCAEAAGELSYVGCEYWPTVLPNLESGADFAIGLVMNNVGRLPARVTLERGRTIVAETEVAPGAVGHLVIPAAALVGHGHWPLRSSLTSEATYRLRSTMPLTVYQLNPWEDDESAASSTSAEASLLLPTHALHDEYLVLGWRSAIARGGSTWREPAIVTVVAAEDVEVRVVPSARVLASLDGRVRETEAGTPMTFTLVAGEAVQLVAWTPETCDLVASDGTVDFCDLGREHDLSGTHVTATGRVGVFSSVRCAWVPFDRVACDHLEEMMPPVRSLGRDAVIALTRADANADAVVRILSAADDNTITFDPPVHAPATLAHGELLELVTHTSFVVSADGPIMVGQFVTGQGPDPRATPSDPAFGIHPPTAQHRRSYRFVSPRTYGAHYVSVVGPPGVTVRIDGASVSSSRFTEIGESGWHEAILPLEGGVHELDADAPVGVMAYGFDAYTGYLYPAGLDVRDLLE